MQNAECGMRSSDCRLRIADCGFCALAVILVLAGCTPAYRPNIRLADSVLRPERSVLLVTVDGLSEPVLDEMLAGGRLPHIAGLIERGVRARESHGSLPSLTYPNLTTLLTGQEPGRHGVLGNKWFDRAALVYRDYATMADYRLVDEDFTAPTVYEYLGDAFTASIQCAVRRGVTRVIDNWATSGIRWFFGGYEAVDQLMPWRFDLIAEEANQRGRWPVLIHAYFPGVDEVGHRFGPGRERYRRALANVDRQIGLMLEAIGQAGMAERTSTILTSDHNHMRVERRNYFDVAGWLAVKAGLRVMVEAPPADEPWPRRRRRFDTVDAVVVIGGDRFASIHLRGPSGWHERPTAEQLELVLGTKEPRLAEQPGVEAAAVVRRLQDGKREVTLEGPQGPFRFAAGDGAADSGGAAELASLFDSARAGDIVLFAAENWDFIPGGAGGHGGLGDGDTRIPMIFSGEMIDPAARLDSVRLVDVTPTILGLLGRVPANAASMFDGRDWSGALCPR